MDWVEFINKENQEEIFIYNMLTEEFFTYNEAYKPYYYPKSTYFKEKYEKLLKKHP